MNLYSPGKRVCARAVITLMVSVFVTIFAAWQLPTTQAATTLTVNSLADTSDAAPGNGTCATATGVCTLRAAIEEANSLAGDDTINFSLTGTINLTGALPVLSSNITINGPGSSLLTVRRDTGGNYRILQTSATSSISGLTITNGRTPDGVNEDVAPSGGGIWQTGGSVTLHDVVITGNTTGNGSPTRPGSPNSGGSGGFGGGIYASGTLTMTDCVISNNTTGHGGNGTAFGGSGGFGAGIYFALGTLTLTRVTISGNRTGDGGGPSVGAAAGSGGGIVNGGTLTVTNSLISGNTTGDSASDANSTGGGIRNEATVTLINTTVSGNSTGSGPSMGGGIFSTLSATLINCTITKNVSPNGFGNGVTGHQGVYTVANTIIAGNGPSGNGPDLKNVLSTPPTYDSLGHNLIGNAEDVSSFNVSGDQTGSTASPLDPHLGPLADNGGPTLTHALLTNSTALDAGDNALAENRTDDPLLTDQRGVQRIADSPDPDTTATVDIGAFEFLEALEDISDQTTNEDTPLTISFGVGDNVATITSVTASSNNQVLIPNGNLVVSGTASVRSLQITPAANQSGLATITVTVNLSGGGTLTDTFTITVNAVNDAPVTNGPSFATTNQQTPLVFSGLNTISVSDVDAGSDPIRVSLTATQGTLTLSSTAGLTFETGDGVDDGTLTFTGPITSINASLNGLTYKPNSGFSGSASLQIVTDDLGHNGSGGAKSATSNVTIQVLSGGRFNFNAATYSVNETGDTATITVLRTGGSAGTATVNYSTSNGTVTAGATCGADVDYIPASGTFTWNNGDTSVRQFTVTICNDATNEEDETINLTLSDAGGTGSLGTQPTATLTIGNDDAPVLLTEELTSHAIALDLVNLTRDPFSLTSVFNMSGDDQRRRVSLFVWRLGSLVSDPPASVTVVARDDEGRTYNLPVEALRPAPVVGDVTQVVVRLPDNVIGAPRDLFIKVTLHGPSSNEAFIKIAQ